VITSRENALIKNILKLHTTAGRKKAGQYFTEGIRSVGQSLKAKAPVDKVIFSDKVYRTTGGRELMERISQTGIKAVEISEGLYKSITDTDNPQHIMAVINIKEYRLKDILQSGELLLVIVDGIQDPGNLGTVIRTADAASAHAVMLLKGTADIYNPKTVRSTMGSVFGIPVIQVGDNKELFYWLRETGVRLIASSPEGDIPYWDIDYRGKIGIIIGNEANGISEQVKSCSDMSAVLPMPGGAESLNAAVACGILLYKALEQRLT
jgi:TrmH family RNA methyltransferase